MEDDHPAASDLLERLRQIVSAMESGLSVALQKV